MFSQHDKVLRKDITYGIAEGIVTQAYKSYQTGEDYLRVRWASGRSSTIKANAVLLSTPENLKLLEDRYDAMQAKIDKKIAERSNVS